MQEEEEEKEEEEEEEAYMRRSESKNGGREDRGDKGDKGAKGTESGDEGGGGLHMDMDKASISSPRGLLTRTDSAKSMKRCAFFYRNVLPIFGITVRSPCPLRPGHHFFLFFVAATGVKAAPSRWGA